MNTPDELQLFMDDISAFMEKAREFAPDPPTGQPVNQIALGSIALEESLSRVKEHNQLFVNAAVTAICTRAAQPGPFTSDDIWPKLFDDPRVEPRAIGAAFREAQKQGVIRSTGKFVRSQRAACHRRPVMLWTGTAFPPLGNGGSAGEAT